MFQESFSQESLSRNFSGRFCT